VKHERLKEVEESPAPVPRYEEDEAGVDNQVPQVTQCRPVQAVLPPRDIHPQDQESRIPIYQPPPVPYMQQGFPGGVRPQGIPANQIMGVQQRTYWLWDIHFRKGCFCMELRHTLAAFFVLSFIIHVEETVSFYMIKHIFFAIIMTIMLIIDIICIWCCFKQKPETSKLIVWLIAVNFFFAILDLLLNMNEIALFAMLLNFYMLALAFSEVNRLLNLQAGFNPYPQVQIIASQPQPPQALQNGNYLPRNQQYMQN